MASTALPTEETYILRLYVAANTPRSPAPALAPQTPAPIRKFIGNLDDTTPVLIDVDVQPPSLPGKAATNVD